jgi:hypothetical protein
MPARNNQPHKPAGTGESLLDVAACKIEANQILMFMADPPSSRHEDENPDISDEKLQAAPEPIMTAYVGKPRQVQLMRHDDGRSRTVRGVSAGDG